ncbi:MAG: hypothetical protein ACU83U_15275 [Gammaproteobacteria bacterium]
MSAILGNCPLFLLSSGKTNGKIAHAHRERLTQPVTKGMALGNGRFKGKY